MLIPFPAHAFPLGERITGHNRSVDVSMLLQLFLKVAASMQQVTASWKTQAPSPTRWCSATVRAKFLCISHPPGKHRHAQWVGPNWPRACSPGSEASPAPA